MSGLAEFVGLVGRVGGPERVVLVGEGPSGSRARLQAFARDLFAPEEGEEEEKEKEKEMKEEEEEEEKKKNEKEEEKEPRREVRVRLGGCGGGGAPSSSSSWLSCSAGLVLVLFGAPSLLVSRERRRLLREILRDLRLRLASRQRPLLAALVAVAVLPEEDNEAEEEGGEKARSQLEGLLRRTFGPGPGKRAQEEQEEGLVQAALYRPGRGAQGVREAACRALRAALRLRQNLQDADEVETKKQKFPLFLKCLPWGRRRQQRKGHLGTDANKVNEDTVQDQDEGLTLT